jgi:DNA-binding NtrC family response regulator
LLSKYSWPGNIRELQATIREALLRSSGSVLLPEFLPQALLDGPSETIGGDAVPAENWQRLGEVLEGWFSSGQTDLYRRALEHFDRLILTRAVKQSNGNQTKASEILGISRFTLRSKLRSANLAIGKVVLPPNTELV